MENEKINILKFLKGFNGLGFLKAVSMALKLALIFSIGWTVYIMIVKNHIDPVKTTTQTAERMTVNYYQEKPAVLKVKIGFFEIKLWERGGKEGVKKK